MRIFEPFVLLHVPRTGGTFLRRTLPQHLPFAAGPQPGGHAPVAALPAQFGDLPILAVVRNPWDWYVSWYCYVSARGNHRQFEGHDGKRREWATAFQNGRSSFAQAVESACTASIDHPLSPMMREEGIDLCTAHVRHITGLTAAPPLLEYVRYDQLHDGVIDFLRRHGALTEDLERAIRESPPVRASDHCHYRDYYDQRTRDLVARTAAPLIEHFSFSF
jgi:hypothetical protein